MDTNEKIMAAEAADADNTTTDEMREETKDTQSETESNNVSDVSNSNDTENNESALNSGDDESTAPVNDAEDADDVEIVDIEEVEKKSKASRGRASEKTDDEADDKTGDRSSVLDNKKVSKRPLKSTEDFVKKQKKRKRTKRIVIIAIIAVALFFIVTYVKYSSYIAQKMIANMSGNNVEMAEVESKTLYESTSATGTLKSLETRTLTANLGTGVATINSVNVEVGDIVTEGDILVEFSTEDIEKDIANQKEDISTQKKIDAISASDDQRSYVNSYTSAANDLQTAAKNVENAQEALYEACDAYGEAKRKLQEAKDDGITYLDGYEKTVADTYQAQQKAQKDYDDAVEAQAKIINNVSTDSLSSADSKYQQSQLNAGKQVREMNRQLEKYEDSLDEYVVTASISGVITEVNVSEGNKFASGNVLTIQDNSGYEAEVLVDEYDIGKVKQAYNNAAMAGQQLQVIVKTEATEDKEFKGHVSSISPTSTTTATASSTGSSGSMSGSSSSVNYKVLVELDEMDDMLMIGMSAKVAIVVNQSPAGALCVPYNAVQEKSDGTYVVRLMDKQYVEKHRDAIKQPEGEEDDSDENSSAGGMGPGNGGPGGGPGGGGAQIGIVVERNDTEGKDGKSGLPGGMGEKDSYFKWLFGKKDKEENEVDAGPEYTEIEVEKIFETDYYAAIVPKYAGSVKEGDIVMIVREEVNGNDLMSMFMGGM